MSDLKITKDTTFNCRMNSIVKSKFAELVAQQGSTMSAYLEKLIISDLKKNGYKHVLTKNII